MRAKEFVADKVTAKELCLEDVCVNKEQLKQLLEKSQIPISNSQSNSNDQNSSTETIEPTLSPEPNGSTTEPVEPLATPEPSPEATSELNSESAGE